MFHIIYTLALLSRTIQIEADRVKKEKAAAVEAVRAGAAEAHRLAQEAAAARKAAEPVIEVKPEQEGGGDEDGEWKQQGSTSRASLPVPASAASKGDEGAAPALWKSVRAPSTGGGLENAFGGSRKPAAFGQSGGGGGDGAGWRGGSRGGGGDAPPAVRGGSDWGGGYVACHFLRCSLNPLFILFCTRAIRFDIALKIS